MIEETAPFVVRDDENCIAPVRTARHRVIHIIEEHLAIADVSVRMIVVAQSLSLSEQSRIDIGNRGQTSRSTIRVEIRDWSHEMDQLTNAIGDLEIEIAATVRKLTASQGEKDLLARDLTRLRAEKAELERQFNNLALMRAQFTKLKEEMAISRRLEFMRLNLSAVTAKGGAQGLMTQPAKRLGGAISYDLMVRINQKPRADRSHHFGNCISAPTAGTTML